MTARRPALRPALVAVVAGVLAAVLWWLARDLVVVAPPTRATDVADGDVARTVVDPRLLLAAALAAEHARGRPLAEAVAGAKGYVHAAIAGSYWVGPDCGVLGFVRQGGDHE